MDKLEIRVHNLSKTSDAYALSIESNRFSDLTAYGKGCEMVAGSSFYKLSLKELQALVKAIPLAISQPSEPIAIVDGQIEGEQNGR